MKKHYVEPDGKMLNMNKRRSYIKVMCCNYVKLMQILKRYVNNFF